MQEKGSSLLHLFWLLSKFSEKGPDALTRGTRYWKYLEIREKKYADSFPQEKPTFLWAARSNLYALPSSKPYYPSLQMVESVAGRLKRLTWGYKGSQCSTQNRNRELWETQPVWEHPLISGPFCVFLDNKPFSERLLFLMTGLLTLPLGCCKKVTFNWGNWNSNWLLLKQKNKCLVFLFLVRCLQQSPPDSTLGETEEVNNPL